MSFPNVSDVSSHNPDGGHDEYRGSGRIALCFKATEGPGVYRDTKFDNHRRRCEETGLIKLIYHFGGSSYRWNNGSPFPIGTGHDEARFYLDTLGGLRHDEYPVLDWEVIYGLSPNAAGEFCRGFRETVQAESGKRPLLYSYGFIFDATNLDIAGNDLIWIAAYPGYADRNNPPRDCVMWQFTNGTTIPSQVPGFGNVDDNFVYVDLQALVGGGGSVTSIKRHPTYLMAA